ncbi:MAG: murD [Frankiales bacterium]|nr:murD [Frankiales bacterium]
MSALTAASPDPEFGEDFAGRSVLVTGWGLAARSAIRALLAIGAAVSLTVDGLSEAPSDLPSEVRFVPIGGSSADAPLAGVEFVVTSPGLPPSHPLLVAAVARDVPVLSELEFAWRIRRRRTAADTVPAAWLMVTGTNGKTTTVHMLESILRAAGRRALAVGNVGVPIIDAVRAEPPYDVLVVEASSFQLEFSTSIVPAAGVLLNLAEDHLDWHGSMARYVMAKAKVWRGQVAVANADDAAVRELADQVEPAGSNDNQLITFAATSWASGRFGVRDGQLLDGRGRLLALVAEVTPPGSHNVANALAAAALAEVVGVEPDHIRRGLLAFRPDPHRNESIGTVGGVQFVDDSKATNPHAAAGSLSAYERIVWIAGGQLKGASVDDLVRHHVDRLVGVVLLGADRAEIADALARHAPDLPVIDVSRTDDGAMTEVVTAAASLARAGDVVLLAPAAASKDMYAGYDLRGAAFRSAVSELAGRAGPA